MKSVGRKNFAEDSEYVTKFWAGFYNPSANNIQRKTKATTATTTITTFLDRVRSFKIRKEDHRNVLLMIEDVKI